ncbi:MAG: hypothetical protein MRJ92_01625 [Nitrospira sp.]|nr:hypothetical protein [Nitrospira sp.]
MTMPSSPPIVNMATRSSGTYAIIMLMAELFGKATLAARADVRRLHALLRRVTPLLRRARNRRQCFCRVAVGLALADKLQGRARHRLLFR